MGNPVEDAAKNGEGLLSRINHPIFGAFLGSWFIWNWKIVYLLICGFKSPQETITNVTQEYLVNDYWGNISLRWGSVVVYPALSTLGILILGPILHDGYILFKKWVNAWINKVEPIPKSQYVRMEYEKIQAINERVVIQGAYNLVRKKEVEIPGTDNGIGMEERIPANNLVQNYLSNQRELVEIKNERDQLKADLLEAEKRIEKLEENKNL
ncbi:MAG TPA: hypothetical protein VHE12_03880 [bacterium]|nr:hypothetical protein [bacterium]